jgi:hypothetical protein
MDQVVDVSLTGMVDTQCPASTVNVQKKTEYDSQLLDAC